MPTTKTIRVDEAELRLIQTLRGLEQMGRVRPGVQTKLARLLSSDLASPDGKYLERVGIFSPKGGAN